MLFLVFDYRVHVADGGPSSILAGPRLRQGQATFLGLVRALRPSAAEPFSLKTLLLVDLRASAAIARRGADEQPLHQSKRDSDQDVPPYSLAGRASTRPSWSRQSA